MWIDIKGYKGLYQINDKPKIKVRRLTAIVKNRGNITMLRKGKILKPSMGSYGYLLFGLSKNGISKNYSRARLVGLHFVKGRTKLKNQINHKNGIKIDDRPINLEWCTASHNLQHACDTGLRKKYLNTDHWNSVPIVSKNTVTSEEKTFGSIHEAARKFEMKVPRIWKIIQTQGTTRNNLQFSYTQ